MYKYCRKCREGYLPSHDDVPRAIVMTLTVPAILILFYLTIELYKDFRTVQHVSNETAEIKTYNLSQEPYCE